MSCPAAFTLICYEMTMIVMRVSFFLFCYVLHNKLSFAYFGMMDVEDDEQREDRHEEGDPDPDDEDFDTDELAVFNEDEDDVGDDTSSSVSKRRHTVMNHLDKFLTIMHRKKPAVYPEKMDDIEWIDGAFTKKFFGVFSSYLEKSSVNSSKGAHNYLSTLKGIVENLLGPERGVLFFGNWYKSLRVKLLKRYVEEWKKSGKEHKGHHKTMKATDLEKICELLFGRNTPLGMQQRALLNLLWQAFGRICEISCLEFSHLSKTTTPHFQALLGDIDRFKTDTETLIHLCI
jgi:hypothetical protein